MKSVSELLQFELPEVTPIDDLHKLWTVIDGFFPPQAINFRYNVGCSAINIDRLPYEKVAGALLSTGEPVIYVTDIINKSTKLTKL